MLEEVTSKTVENIGIEWYPAKKKYEEYLKIEKCRPDYPDFEMGYIDFREGNNWKLKTFSKFFIRVILPASQEENTFELNGIVMDKDEDGLTFMTKRFTFLGGEFNTVNQVYWNAGPSDQKVYEWRDGCLSALYRIDHLDTDISQKFLGKKKLTLLENFKNNIYFKKYEYLMKNLNHFQQEAAVNALENTFTLIQGPPGTGKTTTSAAILELLGEELSKKTNANKFKILVLADSNKAVDNLTLKLMDRKQKVLRIMSFTAQKSGYNPKLNPVCYHYLQKKRAKAEVNDIVSKARFFCCTLDRASRLEKMQEFNYFQFPYSLVDEATQSIELQTVKAIKSSTEKFILVGDQCQLGPVFQSQESHKFGLTSSFERLVKEKESSWVRLGMQYRMHSEISDISSKLFYDGEIETGVEDSDRMKFNQYKSIFRNSRPIIFYDVAGFERRQRESYANDQEKDIVIDILQEFEHNPAFDPKKLAVISNYSSQIFNLKSEIRKSKFSRKFKEFLEVDTVDAFQGREKDFVIISTVRANKHGNVGFLKDSRRMNVAVTRAKHGVVIVGNKDTLMNEDKWGELIEILEEKNCVFHKNDWESGKKFYEEDAWICFEEKF